MKTHLAPLSAPLAYVVLGLILLLRPTAAASVLFSIMGVLLLIYGAVTVIGFFTRSRSVSQLELVFGIVAVVVGGLLLAHPHFLLELIFTLLGIYILADGLVNLKRGLDLRDRGYAGWTTTLVTSVISVLLGLFILWRQGRAAEAVLLRIVGAAFLYEGIVDLLAIRALGKLDRE